MEHVTRGQIAKLLSRDLLDEERRRVMRHLIGGCRICAERAKAAFAPDDDLDYTGLIRRLDLSAIVARGEIDSEKRHAERVWARIRELPQERRLFIVKNNPECQTWGVLMAALEDMKVRISNDPLGALDLADLAVIISEALDEKRYGEPLVADFRAGAYTSLGNTKRILGDFHGAEVALRRSTELLRMGTGDPYENANLISIYCSLRADLGYLEDATETLNQALRHARRVKDRHLIAKLTFQQSSYIGFVDPLAGFELAGRGASLIEPGESLFLESAGKYLTAYWTNELGDPRLASALFESARYMFDNFKDTFWVGRLMHLRANIARQEGNLRNAEFLFRELVDLYSKNGSSGSSVGSSEADLEFWQHTSEDFQP